MLTLSPVTVSSTEQATRDNELVARFRTGDLSAFTEIALHYRAKLRSIAHSFLHNAADAEEIAQDALVRAYRGLDRFRGDSSLATWLNRVTVNLARNRYWYFKRRHRADWMSMDYKTGEDNTGTFGDMIADQSPDPAQVCAREEFTRLVEECTQALPEPQREALRLRTVMNLPYEEIAERMQIEVGTVKSRIARAREMLRQLIHERSQGKQELEERDDREYFIASRACGVVRAAG